MKDYIKGVIERGRFIATALGIVTPIEALTKNQLLNTRR